LARCHRPARTSRAGGDDCSLGRRAPPSRLLRGGGRWQRAKENPSHEASSTLSARLREGLRAAARGNASADRGCGAAAPGNAAKSVVLNIAEAAGRVTTADKARAFTIARGECVEASAGVEVAWLSGAATKTAHAEVGSIACEVYAMLTALIRR